MHTHPEHCVFCFVDLLTIFFFQKECSFPLSSLRSLQLFNGVDVFEEDEARSGLACELVKKELHCASCSGTFLLNFYSNFAFSWGQEWSYRCFLSLATIFYTICCFQFIWCNPSFVCSSVISRNGDVLILLLYEKWQKITYCALRMIKLVFVVANDFIPGSFPIEGVSLNQKQQIHSHFILRRPYAVRLAGTLINAGFVKWNLQ